MPKSHVKVLLLANSPSTASSLLHFLQDRGCHCAVAAAAQAINLPDLFSFDLILSALPLTQDHPMVRKLAGAHCRVFYQVPVEDGCWWVPLEGREHKRLGGPAVRRKEFAAFLDRIVEEIKAEAVPAAQDASGVKGVEESEASNGRRRPGRGINMSGPQKPLQRSELR
jgi:hypothetical protein